VDLMQEHKQRGGCSPVGKHFAIFADLVPAHPIGGVAARPPPLDYRHQHGMTLWIFGVSASARFLLWAQRVRDDAQTGRPKTIRPALALANIGAQPGFVVINAFLRTKALKRSPVPHEAELAMAVSAVIFHDFLSESAAARANRQRRAALATGGKTVAALRFQNSARDTRRAAE